MSCNADGQFRGDRDVGAGREHLVDVAGPHVDFLVRPLPRVDVVMLAEERDAAEKHLTLQVELRIDGALTGIFCVVDEIGRRGRLKERPLGDRQREIHARDEGERKVRLLLVAVRVEDVVVDAQLFELQGRLGVQRTYVQPAVLPDFVNRRRCVGLCSGRVRNRPGDQQCADSHDRSFPRFAHNSFR